MSDDFDPYYSWLGIPPEEQPANHYRLLGVRLFEPSEDVISNAADQRLVYLRTFQIGKRSQLSQRLLNELTRAKVCLLNPETRSSYDQQLRITLAPQVEPVLDPLVPMLQQASPLDALPATDQGQMLSTSEQADGPLDQINRWVHSASLNSLAAILAVSFLGLSFVVLGGVVIWATSRGSTSTQQVASAPPSVTSAPLPTPVPTAQASPVPEPASPKVPVNDPAPNPLPMAVTSNSLPPKSEMPSGNNEPVTNTKETPAEVKSAPTVDEPPYEKIAPEVALAELNKLGVTGLGNSVDSITSVVLQGPLASDDIAKYLAALPKISSLRFGGPNITGESLRHIARMKPLTNLAISGQKITDADLVRLASLSNLKELILLETNITGKGFSQLKSMPSVEVLLLPATVQAEMVQHFLVFPNLKVFSPIPPGIRDSEMKVLEKLTKLTHLNLYNAPGITEEGYKSLEKLTNLELCIISPMAPKGAYVHLANAKLTELNFPFAESEKALELFTQMQSVRNITPPLDLSDEGLRHIAKFPNLEVLQLLNAQKVTDKGLEHLANVSSLRHLFLGNVGDKEIVALAKIRSLQFVLFPNADLRVENWEPLADLPKLQHLMTPRSFGDESIKVLKSCRSLKSLSLQGDRVTTKGLNELKSLSKLESLAFTSKRFSKEEIAILQEMESLKSISFQHSQVAPDDLASLRAALPKCQINYFP